MKGSSKHIQLAPETQFRDKKPGPPNELQMMMIQSQHTVISQQSPSIDQFNSKVMDNTIEKSRWIKEQQANKLEIAIQETRIRQIPWSNCVKN